MNKKQVCICLLLNPLFMLLIAESSFGQKDSAKTAFFENLKAQHVEGSVLRPSGLYQRDFHIAVVNGNKTTYGAQALYRPQPTPVLAQRIGVLAAVVSSIICKQNFPSYVEYPSFVIP